MQAYVSAIMIFKNSRENYVYHVYYVHLSEYNFLFERQLGFQAGKLIFEAAYSAEYSMVKPVDTRLFWSKFVHFWDVYWFI